MSSKVTDPQRDGLPAELYSQAATLDFRSYLKVARTREVDQAFWDCLLPHNGRQQGVALLLETRLGALSARLARHYSKVIAWHGSTAAADITAARMDRSGIRNVEVTAVANLAALALAPASIAALVIYGPSTDLTAQWSTAIADLIAEVLAATRHALAPNAVMLLGENNRWSYKDDRESGATAPAAGRLATLRDAQRVMAEHFTHQQTYVCSSSINSAHTPLPDFVRQDATDVGAIFPKNLSARLKNRLLGMWHVRFLWPSFLIVASNGPASCLAQDILRDSGVPAKLGWPEHATVRMQRLIAGNSGTTILLAECDIPGTVGVVMRLPINTGARNLCEANFRALGKLANTTLAARVPVALAAGLHRDQYYTIEKACPGTELFYGTEGQHDMLAEACESLRTLHQDNGATRPMSTADFDHQVGHCIDDIATRVGEPLADRLARFRTRLSALMVGRLFRLGYTHGDFKVGNILYTPDRRLSGLIDWDGFCDHGLQMFDYLTLLTYKLSNEQDEDFAQVYLAHLLPWRVPAEDLALVQPTVNSLPAGEREFKLVRVAFWFSLISRRFDAYYKYHSAWQSRNVLAVLPELEATLDELAIAS